jgi:transposase
MTTLTREVVAGVDTHADTHHVAVIDTVGRKLADAQFPTTTDGYAALLLFLLSFGAVLRVGIEGTGSYGAGLARHLREAGLMIREVIRPQRQLRRTKGKSDPIDAYAAAAAALAEPDLPAPKTGDGQVEAVRQLLVARRSAVKARTAAIAQIKMLLVTAPETIRAKFRSLDEEALISALARTRPAEATTAAGAAGHALRSLAKRHQTLTEEIDELDALLETLVKTINPGLVAARGLGTVTSAQLLVTAGDNPDRLRSEASFAALCGVSPIPASSGKTTRHRLNRGGDRQANSAIHRIALVRMSCDPRTRDYIARLTERGKSTKEAMRCLKRAIAREVFHLITQPIDVPAVDDLRPLRHARGLTLDTVAAHFDVWPAKVSQIERGVRRDDDFAIAYRDWLNAA